MSVDGNEIALEFLRSASVRDAAENLTADGMF